jgi:hypothetical protein
MPVSVGMQAHQLREAHLRAADCESRENVKKMFLLRHVSKGRR